MDSKISKSIEEILKAEEEAKQIIEKAKKEADELLAKANVELAALDQEYRRILFRKKEQMIRKFEEEMEVEKKKILKQAKEKAERILKRDISEEEIEEVKQYLVKRFFEELQ